MVQAGLHRRRVEIQSQEAARDDYGEITRDAKAWVTQWRPWARIVPMSGREPIEVAQVQSEATHRIEIRYRSGVTTEHRVVMGARVFEILSALDQDERRRKLFLMCKERS